MLDHTMSMLPLSAHGLARAQANAPGASAAAALPEGFCIGCPPPPAGTPAGAPYVKPGYLAAYTCCAVPPAAQAAASAISTAAVGAAIPPNKCLRGCHGVLAAMRKYESCFFLLTGACARRRYYWPCQGS